MKRKAVSLLLGTLLPTLVIATPTVKYEGGRYYIAKDGEILDQYYLQDYTAKAAAANLSFTCKCPITIIQPTIKVSTTTIEEPEDTNFALLTWSVPTTRLDGTLVEAGEIDHYVVREVNTGTEHKVTGTTLRFDQLSSGTYTYEVRAVDINNNSSAYSSPVSKTIE